MNLQGMFQLQFARDDWQTYCREPVKSKAQAQRMLERFAECHDEPARVVLEDWDNIMDDGEILYPLGTP